MASEKSSTREQLHAQKFDRHLAVTANAGSGKTTVLEQRYINILLNGNCNKDPRKIIAITFTRKAAAEIRSRIAANLDERIKTTQHKSEQIMLENIRSQLSNAPISTIHSFCSSLLRDFPIESKTPPNFSELKEVEKINIINNSIIMTLEEWLEDKSGDKNQKVRELFTMFGRDKIQKFIYSIIAKRELLPALHKFYSLNNDETLIHRNDYLSQRYIKPYSSIIEKFFLYIRKTSIDLNLEILPSLQNDIPDTSSLEKFMIKLKDTFDSLKSNKVFTNELFLYKTLRAKLIKLNSFTEEELIEFDSLNPYLKILYEIASSFEDSEQDKELLRYSRIFLEITDDVLKTMEDEKQAVSGIDFDDMLIKTLDLLNDNDLVEKVRSKFNYLMVDEFQDTNGLQYDIIKKLVPELDSNINNNNINFFIVGDAKQSIYGFRNADVRVFNKAKEEIFNTNKRLEEASIITIKNDAELTENEKYGNIQIPVSFRLKPVLAAFVNRLCGEIMWNKDWNNGNSSQLKMSEYDVDYSEFVCSKDSDELITYGNGKDGIDLTETNKFGAVSLLININNKKEKENVDEEPEDENPGEAVMLARYLINLVNSDDNNIKWSDITVLGRKRAGFNELIKKFQEFEIPYILHTGSGFYNAQEIIDICSFLRFLHNQDDNISCAGILRSPFFKIPDNLLYKISKIKNGFSFWNKFEKFCDSIDEVNNNEQEKSDKFLCLRAKKIIEELIAISARVPIAILIQKILELTGWYAVTAKEAGENQKKANINKLIDYSRSFEEQGFKNLFDFVEELNLTIDSEINESEAVYLTGENAVNIMTIHAAKGLDFPIVCLYNTDSKTSSTDSFIISDELGFAFKLPVISEDGIIAGITTPIYEIAKTESRLMDDAEEKRVLYVALTRAKEQLIISGNINEIKNGYSTSGFLKIIMNGLGHSIDDFLIRPKLVYEDYLKILNEGNIQEISLKYPFKIYKNSDISEQKIITANELEPIINSTLLIDEILSSSESEMYSATKLMVFKNNNEEYKRRYFFGLPSEDDDEFSGEVDSADSEDEKLIGTFAGTLIHSVLENIKSWFDEDGRINKNSLIEKVDELILNTDKIIKPKLMERIIDECYSVVSSHFINSNAKNIHEAKTEHELQIPFEKDFLLAKIDLLLRNSDGAWEIWDWKTNKVESIDKFKFLIEHYKLQMQVYSYFVYLLYPEQQHYNAHLLFTRKAKGAKSDEDWIYTFRWSNEEVIGFESLMRKTIKNLNLDLKL